MKRVKLLATGGTIASLPSAHGLEPGMDAGSTLQYVSELSQQVKFDYEDIFNLDSSNIQPEQWRIIAAKIYDCLPDYDGIIVTHGTDTMSYTAAALSFMLHNLDKPVVLTGAQIPMSQPNTDARTNLCAAVAAIEAGMQGVMVAFDHKIINGTRAVKVSTMSFDAFCSVNAVEMAKIYADGIRVTQRRTALATGPVALRDALDNSVFLLKLIPGTNPAVFDAIEKLGYRGVVIEAFGVGGMHYLGRDLLAKLTMLSHAKITVLICSQCLYERSDLNIYEVGQRILETGAVSAEDMTTEAAVTKLMWVLGQTSDQQEILRLLRTNIAGEISQEYTVPPAETP